LTDNFYNETIFEIGLKRYGKDAIRDGITVKVLPFQRDAPIYMHDGVRPRLSGENGIAAINEVEVVESQEAQLSTK
jgi:beta-galactosidase